MEATPKEAMESLSRVSNTSDNAESSRGTSNPNPNHELSLEERFEMVRSVGEGCIEEDELLNLLAKKAEPVCCVGFELSAGRMDIDEGVRKAIKVKKLISAGCRVKIWIADWCAMQNDGGDPKKTEVKRRYFKENLKALGIDADEGKVEFVWESEARPAEYWPLVIDISSKFPYKELLSCIQITGQREQDESSGAHIFYPGMKCAPMFLLKADVCLLGRGADQRKMNKLAREYCDHIKRKDKPIILSHDMLPGLQQGQVEVSKSDPSSSIIFMDDGEADVNLKIKKAYCPPKVVEGNPCLEYIKELVMPSFFNEFSVERSAKNGGNKTFKSFEELIADYESGELHPADLKPALAKSLNRILEPVREHFRKDSNAKNILKGVKAIRSACCTNIGNAMESLSVSISDKAQSSGTSKPSPTDRLNLEERFEMVRSVGEECIQEDELLNLLARKPEPVCYDGFEPSGRMHIAQGITKALNVKKLTSAGCRFKIWIADWFAKQNNKLGGDMKKIEEVGRYFIEVWKALGMDAEGGKVEFLWASKEINARPHEYWPLVFDIAKTFTIKRLRRCTQIMGRSEQDEISGAQMIYPCMQCADIFFLNVDICQLGKDQRKVNVLAREYCDVIKRKDKPIILSHHMLPGLQQGQAKMSKSDPSSSIFMDDEEAEVKLKISNAYCPPEIVEGNPCLEYVKGLIKPSYLNEFSVERSAENGGNKTFKSFEEVIVDYESGELQPADLKPALAKSLNIFLERVREHWRKNSHAKDVQKKAFRVTR